MPRPPLPRRRRAATPVAPRLALAALLLALSCGGACAGAVAAVETGGFGTLTKCRSWLVLNTCHKYEHVAVPEEIRLGDQLDITFGSNLKEYFFPVARIARGGESCTLYSEKDGRGKDVDRIEISPCHPATTPSAPSSK